MSTKAKKLTWAEEYEYLEMERLNKSDRQMVCFGCVVIVLTICGVLAFIINNLNL